MKLPSRVDFIQPKLPLSAEDWNIAVDELRMNLPLVVGGKTSGGWTHPWKPSALWDKDIEMWRIAVKPGFVNGSEVEVVMPFDHAPTETQLRVEEGDRVRAWLSEEPYVAIAPDRMRRIGPDGDPTGASGPGGLAGALFGSELDFEEVHPFFRSLGVGDSPSTSFVPLSGFQTEQRNPEDLENDRLLRRVEIVLTQERFGTATEWTVGGPIGGISIAEFSVIYTNATYRESPYIQFFKEWVPPLPGDDSERIQGNWEDTPYDQIKIADVYFVSPPGAALGSEPDGSWEPYYQNHVYWNLNHRTNILPVQSEPDPLILNIPPLAGGITNAFFDTYIAINNDLTTAAFEYLNNRTLEGRFWTT